ncbi:hypothetical protein GUJ93_ZPchr0006g41327 [Zizania palustris]|uniref:Uncharacterized protein n=1 Tax=Zizania palustris TaxID=103762 RepID=A0A8J5W3K9_ZIZPA|nr:hypothetical protein GUJ93_ZPchr0006g41327 [Zizania palustris]
MSSGGRSTCGREHTAHGAVFSSIGHNVLRASFEVLPAVDLCCTGDKSAAPKHCHVMQDDEDFVRQAHDAS